MKRELTIEPHQNKVLRYAFGAATTNEIDTLLPRYQVENLDMTANGWKSRLAYFPGQDASLQREMAWHTYNLLSATTYNAFFNVHSVPLGIGLSLSARRGWCAPRSSLFLYP